jgi:hypothetical protein
MPRDRSRPLFILAVLLVAAAILFFWLRGEPHRDPAPRDSTAEPTETRPAHPPDPAHERPPADETAPRESRPETKAADRLRVFFVDEDGAAVVGYAALFFEDGRLIHGIFETANAATFDAVRLPASVVILPYSRDPAVAALSAGSGDVTVRLTQGAVVSGKAFVNGAVPATELELLLVSTPPSRFRDSWPAAVDRWMQQTKPQGLYLRAWPNLRDGSFRFSGLHAEWKGVLQIPNGYRMEGVPARDIPLGQPTSGIVLNLVEMPHLRGRVVMAKTRVPIPGAAISLRVGGKGGEQSGIGGLWSDAGGRFAVPVPGDAVWKAGSLSIFNLRNSGVRHLPISEADLAQGRDLGDVEVEAPRAASLRIKSKKGVPIEAARVVAMTPPDHLGPIARSGKDGKAEFVIRPTATGLRVVASGYEPVEIPIPAADTETEVVLARDTRLTIRVVLADGVTDADGASLWLESDHEILRPSAKSERDYVVREPPDYDATIWETADEGARVNLGQSPATISCIRPGKAFHVRAKEPLTGTTASQSVVLAEEEWKTVVLTLPIPARRLEGKVVDPAGEPLYQAQVFVEGVGVRRTGRDGTFLFDRLTLDRVKVSVELPGFARWSQEVALSPEGVKLSIQLTRAEPLTISVVDSRGDPVEGATLSIPAVSKMSATSVMRTDAKGQVVLTSPPDGEFAITVQLGTVTSTETHRATAQGIVIRLPP